MRQVQMRARWCLILAAMVPSTLLGQTVSDKYQGYVDKAIPLSFTIADADASIREADLFLKMGSEAQSHLSYASEAEESIVLLAPMLKTSAELTSHDVSADEAIAQVLVSTQIVDQYSQMTKHIAAYRKIAADFPNSCSKSFDDYNIENARADFDEPEVNPFDGVYVHCSADDKGQSGSTGPSSDPSGNNSQSGGCNLGIFFASLGESLYHIIFNQVEMAKIKEQAERLAKDRAQTSHYRTYAKNHCEKDIDAYKPVFTQYDSLVDLLNESAQILSSGYILESQKKLKAFVLDKYSEQVINQHLADARTKVAATLGAQDKHDEQTKMSIRTNLNIQRQLSQFPSASCDARTRLYETAMADIALRTLYDLPSSEAISALSKAKAEADKRCSEMAPQNSAKTATLKPAVYIQSLSRIRPWRTVPAMVVSGGRQCVLQNGSSFCSDLNTFTASGPSVYQTSSMGGYCGTSGTGSYSYCNSAPFSPTAGAATDVWGDARAWVALAQHFPGVYDLNSNAAQVQGEKLDRQLSLLQTRADQLNQIASDLTEGQKKYLQGTIQPAVQKSVQTVTSQQGTVLKGQLVPAFQGHNQLPAPNLTVQPKINFNDTATRALVDQTNLAANLPSANERWAKMEPAWRIRESRLSSLNSSDQQLLMSTVDKYFSQQGLLNSGLSGATQKISTSVGDSLRTERSDPEGHIVRLEVNRALAALDSSSSEQQRTSALGGLALSMGADNAYAERDTASGDHLVNQAAAAVDLAVGLIPVASSVNDALQIIHGMMTGVDYAGRPMAAGDYALRGVGVVLGLVPAGRVLLGGRFLGQTFLDGCAFLKMSGMRTLFQESMTGLKTVSVTAAEAVGDLFWRVNPDLKTLIVLNNDANRTFHLFAGSRRILKTRGIKEFWEVLRSEGNVYSQEERLQFIRTFRTGISYEEVETEMIGSRWESAADSRPERLRFLGRDTITDRTTARSSYAIPAANKMEVLNEYRITPGNKIFTGEVAPNFGQPGGAQQIFVTGPRSTLDTRVIKSRTIIGPQH